MTDATAKPVRLADGAELDSFVDEHDAALVEFYTSGCSMCHTVQCSSLPPIADQVGDRR